MADQWATKPQASAGTHTGRSVGFDIPMGSIRAEALSALFGRRMDEAAAVSRRAAQSMLMLSRVALIGPEPRRQDYLQGRSAVGYRRARRRWGRAKKRLRRLGWGERTAREVYTYLPHVHVQMRQRFQELHARANTSYVDEVGMYRDTTYPGRAG